MYRNCLPVSVASIEGLRINISISGPPHNVYNKTKGTHKLKTIINPALKPSLTRSIFLAPRFCEV